MLNLTKAHLNNFIIKSYQEYEFNYPPRESFNIKHLNNQAVYSHLWYLIVIGSFWIGEIWAIKQLFIDYNSNSATQVLVGLLICIWSIDLFDEYLISHKTQLNLCLAILMHKILDNKKVRAQEIALFFKKKNEINKKISYLTQQASLDIKKFCIRHFKISAPGFINFYQKRAFLNSEPCISFILYSLCVPKKDELGPDRLRKILLSYTPVNNYSPYIDLAFKNYSHLEIEELFTNYQGKKFLKHLITDLNENPRVLPSYTSFYQMELMESTRKKLIPKKLKELNNKVIKGYQFQLLITNEDYLQTSEAFSNCVHRYNEDLTTFLIRVKYQNKDYACISIIDNKIDEIKGVKNREIKNNTLKNIIKGFL